MRSIWQETVYILECASFVGFTAWALSLLLLGPCAPLTLGLMYTVLVSGLIVYVDEWVRDLFHR